MPSLRKSLAISKTRLPAHDQPLEVELVGYAEVEVVPERVVVGVKGRAAAPP